MPAKITSRRLVAIFSGPPSTAAKRASLMLTALAVLVVLSACGSTTSTQSAASKALTPTQRLALGTLKLETTDQAVDAQLATQLLPLWQLMAELDSNSSTAPQETAAVVEQIQTTMTAGQINAINKMKLTQSDIAKASANGGATTVASSAAATSGTQVASAAAGALMGAAMPAGAMPPDGGGPMPGGSSQQSNAASRSSGTASAPSLVEQVIDLLESKIQS